MSVSREEKETVIRFDATNEPAYLYTADPVVAARWAKLGVAMNLARKGSEHVPPGWEGRCPKSGVKVRRLVDGALVKRKVDPSAADRMRRNRQQPILPE